MKPSLQLKLSQHLTLTPQLQQSIKLLQLSTIELNQEIERVLLENPMLEREDGDGGVDYAPAPPPGNAPEREAAPEPAAEPAGESITHEGGEGSSEDEGIDWSNVGQGASSRSEDDEDGDYQDIQAAGVSLREHLDQQVALSPLSDRDRALVRFLIEALDDDGYLHQPLEDLLELLPQDAEVDLDELAIALRHVQSLEPAGIGARSPQECLALQLQALPECPIRPLALEIVTSHLELLAERNFARIRKLTGCDDEGLREAQALICSLDPHPGSRYSTAETRYVLPDVVVRKLRGQWTVSLNQEAMPRLRINRLYASLLQQNRAQGGGLGGQLQEARWLIKNVQQRFDTILRVSQAIVDQQRQFFDHGDVAMRPLTLREIADQLELHESTVSRVTTQKYMATPRGVFELKYFFGSHVATDTGGAASSTAIRALIRQLVDAEDSKKPLSDAKIAEILGQQGIVVARRTIAKYRESLNIPPVSLRKSL
ncbi:MAG TPA: RNA polymerase factor sigma-54 [Thauera aminoaromatica]|jgi:RNA polymerase sigma-54 factor|uniref:RNA polymerase sigma-54 factor n=2 Tax=Thauera aminoaromatica TaxID=164330 RepID=C4ZIW7_THASP|nr:MULTISPECIES: RNA polymerase factor sigma-54 [Thauera]MDA0233498.1 RNA polymerase factor sigma-54 [Pseudomonadota bacterium]ACK53480.1 RNA polymerase, sigma 54 subunit, RpoN [Thauera aminoaromatica]ENO85723.1 RNA polymerase factor sigma-54 [Thauera aminoaromatica S2]KIN89882.1 RNA polymerase sigma-54 factor [Thauera sp. SWB20]MBP6131534.1 RNA polymerase factor sigma-54 [Thauera sp.]